MVDKINDYLFNENKGDLSPKKNGTTISIKFSELNEDRSIDSSSFIFFNKGLSDLSPTDTTKEKSLRNIETLVNKGEQEGTDSTDDSIVSDDSDDRDDSDDNESDSHDDLTYLKMIGGSLPNLNQLSSLSIPNALAIRPSSSYRQRELSSNNKTINSHLPNMSGGFIRTIGPNNVDISIQKGGLIRPTNPQNFYYCPSPSNSSISQNRTRLDFTDTVITGNQSGGFISSVSSQDDNYNNQYGGDSIDMDDLSSISSIELDSSDVFTIPLNKSR